MNHPLLLILAKITIFLLMLARDWTSFGGSGVGKRSALAIACIARNIGLALVIAT